MGQTVVFTVNLDDDDVAIEESQPRPSGPPRRPIREAARTALADKRWRAAALAVLVLPGLAAAITYAITRGEWVVTAFLATAACVTPIVAAWAGARAVTGPWRDRAAHWLVVGAAGAALAVANIPGMALASRTEVWGEASAVPTLMVLAVAGGAGAWLGLALANLRKGWPALGAAAAAGFLTLAPLGLFAALVPETATTEQITYYTFITTYDSSRPAYVCGTEKVATTRTHTEAVAWIAFGSPLLWVVDAATFSTSELASAADGTLAQTQAWTRSTRAGPDAFTGYCYAPTSLGPPTAVKEARYQLTSPIGAQVATTSALLLGVLALASVSRRKSA